MKKSFKLKISRDIKSVSKQFGVSNGFTQKVLDLKIPKELPNVTYITGESGCGKTTLLKELGYKEDKPLFIPDKPIIEWNFKTEIDRQKMMKLSQVGLDEVTIFTKRYSELSDSQKFRARILLQLLSSDKIIFIDDFLSTFDRPTAKAVSFQIMMGVFLSNKKLVVATSHNDLFNYLWPDLYIVGRAFPSRWESFIYKNDSLKESNIIKDIKLQSHDNYWLKQCPLLDLLYENKNIGKVKDIRGAYYENKLIGVLLAKEQRNKIKTVSHIIIHPNYRGHRINQLLFASYFDEFCKITKVDIDKNIDINR